MAYKNSAGASSIKEEWGQWRYFNSALEGIKTRRPTTISITPKSPVIEQQVNWMNVAGDVIKGAMTAFEARKELSYAKADEYLKTHSLQEYQQEMVNGSIPFQDDPIAMQRLKYDHGKLIFRLSEQDFQNRVDRGEFIGLEPEQVDAMHYEHSKKSMQDIADVFGYADGNDYWFNEGFYADSANGRVKMLLDNAKVTNDTLIQQRLSQDSAKIVGLINSGELTPDALLNVISETWTQSGYRYTPKDLSVLGNTILKSLANSPQGDSVLDALKDAEVPGTGMTFSNFLGEAGFEAVKQSAKNLRFNLDAGAKYQWESGVTQMAIDGDVSGLRVMLAQELQANGNVVTDRTDFLHRNIKSAVKAQAKAAATLSKQALYDNASRDWAKYLMDDIDGKEGIGTIEEKKVLYKGTGFTATHMNEVAQKVVVEALSYNGDDPKLIERKSKVLSYVGKRSNTYPALKDFVLDGLKDHKVEYENLKDEFVRKGALDKTSYEAVPYSYTPVGSGTSVYVGDVPKSFAALMSVYHLNPSAASRIFGDDFKREMELADAACILGRNPFNEVVSSKKFLADYRNKAKSEGAPTTPSMEKYTFADDEKGLLSTGSSSMLDALAFSRALSLNASDPSIPLTTALKTARKQIGAEHYKVGFMAIPRVVIEEPFKGLTATEKNLATIGEHADEAWKEITEKYKDNLSLSYYDNGTDTILLIDSNGIERGRVDSDTFSKRVKYLFEKDLNKYVPFINE